MSRPWKVDVVTGSHSPRFVSTRAPDDAAERVGGGWQQPVVGPDQHVATPGLDGDRPSRGADAGVDDPDVDAHRNVGEREASRKAPSAMANFRTRVRDVDDLRIATDADHHAAARRRCAVEPEVGQEAR